MSQQPDLERPIGVNRDRQANNTALLAINVVTAADPQQFPAAPFNQASKFAAGDSLHTTISRMRSLPPGFGSTTSTDRQPSIASRRLRKSSSMVSPCVAQPGMAGTSAQKPPSSAECTTILIFISVRWSFECEFRLYRLECKCWGRLRRCVLQSYICG